MLSRLSKVLILSLLVVSFASAAFATTSRVEALAGTSNYINDDSNIFRWYGTLPSYTRMVMAEVGQAQGAFDVSATSQALGFTHNWGEDHWLGTWGVFVLQNSIEDGSFYLFNPMPTTSLDGIPVPTTKFVLQWGKELEGVSFGFNFTRSDRSVEVEGDPVGNTKNSASFTTIGGGIRWDANETAYVDVNVDIGFAGGEITSAPTQPTDGDLWDKGSSFSVAARAFYEWMDDVTLVPYIGWVNWDFNQQAVAAGTTAGSKGNDWQFGASLDFDVNTNNMLIFATELEFANEKPSQTATNDQTEMNVRHIPKFYIALESDINSWLTTRVGATKTMARTEDTQFTDPDNITTITTSGDFGWSLGLGFHLGEWDVDAVVSEDLPFRLGYWLTGYGVQDSDPPVARVSGTYRF